MSESPAGRACPRCGAATEPGQEYCLECGLRLPDGGIAAAAASTWRRRVGRRPPEWLWTIAAALVVALVMTGVAVAISRGGAEATGPDITATGPATVETPATEPTETLPTEPTGTATGPSTTTQPPPPPPPRPQVVEWPPSQSGYTIVIASIPTGNGRTAAVAKAREALGANLPEVGVLDSGEFSSLHPGYYVVFSGIYADQRSAIEAVGAVQRTYPAAYVRQISR